MVVKMIIVDLDRTLLHTDKTISEYSVSILNQCREKGIKIVFATARPIRTVELYLEQIACDAVIYHNGAFILSAGKRIGNTYSIPYKEARKILLYMQSKYEGKKLSVEINDTLYANFNVKEFWSYTNAIETDFSDIPEAEADKVLVEIQNQEELDDVTSILSTELYGEMSDGKLCLIMNRSATKLNGIRQLSSIWDIPTEHMIAFGDDLNDMEMIKHCGIGVAMKNAIDEVIAIADYVTDTNDYDGVAKYLEKNILSELNNTQN